MSDRSSFTMLFETPTGEQVEVTVVHPAGNAILGIQALKEAGNDHYRMQLIKTLQDDPSIGPLLVEYGIDFSDPHILAALDEFGLDEEGES